MFPSSHNKSNNKKSNKKVKHTITKVSQMKSFINPKQRDTFNLYNHAWRFFLTSVVWTYDTFDNNFGIKYKMEKLLIFKLLSRVSGF